MTRYPSPEDYIRAVQNPLETFRAEDLQGALFPVDPTLRIPMPASGNSAVVFRASVDGTDRALRFFTREDVSDRKRYDAVASHVATGGLADHVAAAVWRDGAVTVGEANWPVVDMQWVEGRTLDVYVDDLVRRGDVTSVTRLAREWRALVGRLQDAEFAHGDLQHGNVLIDTSGSLRLVDLDGAWTPELTGQVAPTETGHPNYQHPGREWGRWMDTFPGLLVYASLLAVAARPGLWDEFYDEENLLFTAADLEPPFHTPLWRRIEQIGDRTLNRLAFQLVRCCTPGGLPETGLDALIRETTSTATTRDGVPWWEKTAGPTSTPTVTGQGTGLPPPPPKSDEPMTVPSVESLGPPRTPTADWFRQGQVPEPESTEPERPVRRRRPVLVHLAASLLAGVVTAALIWLLVSVATGAALTVDMGSGAAVTALVGGQLSAILVLLILRRPE